MRELDRNQSSSGAPHIVERHEIPERTPAQKTQDAIAETNHQLGIAESLLGEVKSAQDPRVWEAKHTSLKAEIATSTKAFEKAKKHRADADTLKPFQDRLTALTKANDEAKPPKGFTELALEFEICAALTATPEGSLRDGHDRKAATIDALFQRLDVAESRALSWRIEARLPQDALVAAFHRLETHRRGPLEDTLKNAARRAALAEEPARRAALMAEVGPALGKRDTTVIPRGLTSTSEAATGLRSRSRPWM